MGEDARSLLIPILPLILRIKIRTALLDRSTQANEVYIEDCKAHMEDYVSPFDETLNLEDNCITLLLKPGHYDILYSENIKYDIGFSEWVNLVRVFIDYLDFYK